MPLRCLILRSQVAGAWSERQKMFHGGPFLKLADDDVKIENPKAQNLETRGFGKIEFENFTL